MVHIHHFVFAAVVIVYTVLIGLLSNNWVPHYEIIPILGVSGGLFFFLVATYHTERGDSDEFDMQIYEACELCMVVCFLVAAISSIIIFSLKPSFDNNLFDIFNAVVFIATSTSLIGLIIIALYRRYIDSDFTLCD